MPSKRFIIALALVLLSAVPAVAAPALQAEGPDFDFGTVIQGAKIEHTFVFRNTGDQTLRIDQVRSSCGCTAALLSASEIAPGGTGEVRTMFDSARFQGAVSKTVYLYSNDPSRSRTDLHLRGTVRPKLEARPAELDLGTLVPGRSKEGRLTLTNHTRDTMHLAGVRATAPGLQPRLLASSVAPGQAVEVVVRAELTSGQQQIGGYLLVQTGTAGEPELRIPVRGTAGGETTR